MWKSVPHIGCWFKSQPLICYCISQQFLCANLSLYLPFQFMSFLPCISIFYDLVYCYFPQIVRFTSKLHVGFCAAGFCGHRFKI
ncbi:hypothetical protein GDO78_012448 [Eleutherodactylus coqui]|uniref:Uncharacterized protein n=1 Tax=Eleutherodactylus coqui TaxID=57060 RepID=A0A8J6F1D5_ELECQ|nr:hypothetical protein GDO78_012448 [Eleutherodactylus coqui]